MALSELKGSVVTAKLWSPLHEVESSALTQLRNISSLPWVKHVAVMPDVHFGKGATVGSVIGMKGAVSPAAVGVDIGCGMGAIRTNLKASDLPENLKKIRDQIERDIPVGFNAHDTTSTYLRLPKSREVLALQKDVGELLLQFHTLDRHVQKLDGKMMQQLGTLGGGNHFIELCLDTGVCSNCRGEPYKTDGLHTSLCAVCRGADKGEPSVWMMLHSGSRNIGKELAEIHIAVAKELVHNQKLPDRDLGVFLAGTPEMQAYRRDLFWAQRYAMLNRRVMFELYKEAVRRFFPDVRFEDPILCHHNYVSEETHFGEELLVTRKGAISAQAGQMGIIPGSMGTKSYIVRGRGNPDSLNSASHGAGRKLSRGKAKRTFTLADLQEQTKGVECRKDEGVIDEIPGAYKDIDQVMANQSDLVQVVAELKGVMCIKG